MFTIAFFRTKDGDDAHATLNQVQHDTADLEDAKLRARSLTAGALASMLAAGAECDPVHPARR